MLFCLIFVSHSVCAKIEQIFSHPFISNYFNVTYMCVYVTGIGQFKLLRQLDIQNNRLTSMGSEMLEMNYLEELYLACNGIETVEGLPRSSRLNTLDLSNNPLRSIEGIQEVCFQLFHFSLLVCCFFLLFLCILL